MTSIPENTNNNFPSFINATPVVGATTTLTAVPASAPPSSIPPSINYAETIRKLEIQIATLCRGPHTPQSKEELIKLQILLQKSKQEQQKLTGSVVSTMENSSGLTGVAGLQSSPIAHTSSPTPTPIAMSGSPIVRPASTGSVASPYVPVTTPVVNNTVGGGSVGGATGSDNKVLDKRRLQELVKEVDPLEQLDDDVEEVLLQVADDFIENVVSSACQIAKHRKSNTLEVKDVQLYLERTWNMWIPGFGSEDVRPFKKACVTEAHKQRMALIRKTLKKY